MSIVDDQYIHIPLHSLNMFQDVRQTARVLFHYGIYSRALHKDFSGGCDDDEYLYAAACNFNEAKKLDFDQIREEGRWVFADGLNFEKKYGRDAVARLHYSVIKETAEGRFKPNDFRVLVAILSCINRRRPTTRITLETLQVRSCGFKSRDILDAEINNLPILATKTIQRRRDKLAKQGFFSFFTYRSRQTMYSVKFSTDELVEYMAKKEIRSGNRYKQAMFNKAIKNSLQETAAETTCKPLVPVVVFPDESIPEGMRNNTLASIAGKLFYSGESPDSVLEELLDINQQHCEPPLCEREVKTIHKSIKRYHE